MSLDKSYLDLARQRAWDGWMIVCRVAPPPTTAWVNKNVHDDTGLLFTEPITRECANELERLGIVECTDKYGIKNRAAGGAYILTAPKAEAGKFVCPSCGWRDRYEISTHPTSVLPLWEHEDECFWVKAYEHISFIERVPKLSAIKISSELTKTMKALVSKTGASQ